MSELHPLATWIDEQQPKITRGEFANRIGTSAPHLSLFLKGKRGLSLEVAVNIERVTNGAFRPADLLTEAA